MKNLADIMKTLAAHKEELKQRYKVKEIGIFGSVVRGEQKGTSDVDILVEFEKPNWIFHVFRTRRIFKQFTGA